MNPQEIHIRDYLRILNKRKITIITFFVIVITIVTVGTFTAIPIYKATTRILIEKSESNPLDNTRFIRYDPQFLETQTQIIKSFNVAKSVVRALSLDTVYSSYFFPEEIGDGGFLRGLLNTALEFVPSILRFASREGNNPKKQEKSRGFTKTVPPSKSDQIAAYLASKLEVGPVRGTRIVTINLSDKNPTLVTMIVNAFAKAYMEEVLEINMSTSSRTLKWMKKKAEEEKVKLETSEKALQKYLRDKDIVTIENRITIIPQKLQEFSSKLYLATAKRKELGEIKKQVNNLKGNPERLETLSIFSSNSSLQVLRGQILKVDQSIEELSKKYGEKHPTMIRAKSERGILLNKRKQEINRIIESVENDYELATANETNLRNLLADTKKEALFLNEKFIQRSILKREVESNRVLYQTLVKELKKQSLSNQSQTVNVWVVEEAKPPSFPDKPRIKINLLLGFVFGLFGGIGLAFFIEYLDNTVKSVEEVERKFGLTVLGTIEHHKDKKNPVERVVQLESTSVMAENYRAIRTAILLSSAENPPRKLLISSMSPQEGKTTVSANLAAVLADDNHKVVLVDCDMRKASLHKIYNLNNQNGLSAYLAGVTRKISILNNNKVAKHNIIPAGPNPPNPAELLGSERFKRLLTGLEKRFDFVILDSPPFMNVTDSLLLSKLVDATLIVCKSGKTSYEILGKGLKLLNNINPHILGIIINGVRKKHASYYYGYNSYYAVEEPDD